MRRPARHRRFAGGVLRPAVDAVDRGLRRRRGVIEFSDDGECLVRIALLRSQMPLRLADGVHIARGDPIVELHLWNEHIPPLPDGGAGFAWANRMRRQAFRSMEALAAYAEIAANLGGAEAFRGRLGFTGPECRDRAADLLARLGFEPMPAARSPSAAERTHDFFEDIWLWGLLRAFNAASRNRNCLRRLREEFWISRRGLIARFGSGARDRDAIAAGIAREARRRTGTESVPSGE